MKMLIISLLLFTGLNQILARVLPWSRHSLDIHDDFLDDDYDLFHIPKNHESIFEFIMDSNEETKEVKQIDSTSLESDHMGAFFGTLLGTFLDNSEEDTNSDEKTQVGSAENREQNNDKTPWEIRMDELFGADEEESSEEKTFTKDEEEKKSSEETKTRIKKINDSNENSDEVATKLDLTKSSEENPDEEENKVKSSEESINKEEKSDENSKKEEAQIINSSKEQNTEVVSDLSESEINELASFFIALNILNDMGVINGEENKDDNVRAKEAEEFLMVYGAMLHKMIEEDVRSKPVLNHKKEQYDSIEKEDEPIMKATTAEEESNENDDINETITTAPKKDSNEKYDDDRNDSRENENDFKVISIVLQGSGEEQGKPQNLDDHKYSVVDLQEKFKPTNAPFKPQSIFTSAAGDKSPIREYVVIRESLDTQQDSLQQHELDLDKDFYNIISSNYDDKSLNKFEEDIYVAHENLDRIKRNINAMQNLQSKLYFHKLVTAAVQDVQNKSKN